MALTDGSWGCGAPRPVIRYRLGQMLSCLTRHFLLMTATPHNGKEEDFQLFLALLDGDRVEGRFRDGVHAADIAAPFLSRMKFVDEQGGGTSPTLAALRVYREHRAAGRRGVPPDAPLDFAPPALQPLIRRDGVTDRRRWESALFLKVRDEIQTGNLAIDEAKNFGRFEAFFLPAVQMGAGP